MKKANTYLRLTPHIHDGRGVTYRLETQHGAEVGYLISRSEGWTVWSEKGYFVGQGAKTHGTLSAMLLWLTGICNLPILIIGGKNDKSKDNNKTKA